MDVSPKPIRHIDHAQRQMRRLGHPGRGDVHEVFQAPGLFGIPEVPRDVEPQTIIVPEECGGQGHVTAEQDDMDPGLGAQGRLAEEDDLQGLRTRRVEPWRLVQTGLEGPLHAGLFEVLSRQLVVIHRAAILATGAPTGIRTGVGEGESRLVPPRGKQGQGGLPSPM